MDAPLNALTVDVEDYFHVAALSVSIKRSDWPSLAPRVDGNTRRLLDLFDNARMKATFFVLGWVAERCPELIKEIQRRGHEVACHGFSHTLVYEQTPEEFRRETRQAKCILEDLIGDRVRGYRAASYSITSASLWALDIIVEEGFDYDSSVFPVRHDLYGIPGFSPVPHRLTTERGAELAEFPPTTFTAFGGSIPVGGGGYFRIYPYWLTEYLLRRINRARSFIFYLHPWEIDPNQPRIAASPLRQFRHYFNLEKTEARLMRLLEDFRFDTVSAVLAKMGLLRCTAG